MSRTETTTPRVAPNQPAPRTRTSGRPKVQALFSRELSVLLVLILLFVAMACTGQRESFFGPRNLTNIARNTAMTAIFAIGETLVIITSGIDLSLGSLIAFTGMLVALLLSTLGVPAWAAILIAVVTTLIVALAIGSIHAALVHKLSLPPFVVTLASMLILRSQSMVIHNQLSIPISDDFSMLKWLANGSIWIVPVPVVILAIVAAVVHLQLSGCRVGRYLYSIGSNETATMLSGVNVYRVKLFAYGMSGLLGGLAGILWAAYGGQGDPQAGNGFEMDAIAAAVVGGASLSGGVGSVVGTVLGATLLMSILSAINLTLASPDIWRQTVVGSVLLFAVLVTAYQRMRASKA